MTSWSSGRRASGLLMSGRYARGPSMKGKLDKPGNDTRVSTPSEFRARVEQDMARWRPLAHVVNQS